MPSIPLHTTPSRSRSRSTSPNTSSPSPLPALLHTPLGLALVEIQGSLNLPAPPPDRLHNIRNTNHANHDIDNQNGHHNNNQNDENDEDIGPVTQIGRLVFPLLSTSAGGGDGSSHQHVMEGVQHDMEDVERAGNTNDANQGIAEGPWMKKVWLFIGKNQRLEGEVRRLKVPLGVVVKRERGMQMETEVDRQGVEGDGDGDGARAGEELEVAAVVRYKLFFGSRPDFV